MSCSRKSKSRVQKGGSPASNIVMSDSTMHPPVMNDYIGPDRIRESWYDPSLKSLEPKCGGQMGGSLASDLVMEKLSHKSKTESFDSPFNPKGDMNSLNLYETTGGARRRRKTRRASRRSRSRSKNNSSRRKSKQIGRAHV